MFTNFCEVGRIEIAMTDIEK